MANQDVNRRVSFKNQAGDDLAAVLDLPAGVDGGEGTCGTVVFAHCFTCTKGLRSARVLAERLVERGYAVLRFDFTGLGDSEGDFVDTTFSSNVSDLVAAADYLRETLQAPSVLVGHSLGGAAVLLAAAEIPEVAAVASIGAPSDPKHLRDGILREADPEKDISKVLVGGRPFEISREFLHDLEHQDFLERLGRLHKPVLIMHSPVDEIVSVDHARKLYQAAKHPKNFISLDGADHLMLNDPADAEFAADMLASWASRYLDSAAVGSGAAALALPEPLSVGVVEVVGGDRKYTNTVRTAEHQLVTDEPKSVGGADLGPNPYEILLASLGACISMTLRMYADRKGIPLETVRVRLKHSKEHAKDCADCETETGLIDVIEKELEIVGAELTPEQLDRLTEISERCPVHRTLTSETRVRAVERVV